MITGIDYPPEVASHGHPLQPSPLKKVENTDCPVKSFHIYTYRDVVGKRMRTGTGKTFSPWEKIILSQPFPYIFRRHFTKSKKAVRRLLFCIK